MQQQRRLTKGLSAITLAAALIAAPLLAAPAQAAPRAIVVWVSAEYQEAAQALFAKGYKKRAIDVQSHDMSTITADLQNADPANAPDIVLIDGGQVGELAANALIAPVEIAPETTRALSNIAISTFRVADALFGMPMQRQNLALVTNANLIPKAPQNLREAFHYGSQNRR